MIRSNMLFLLLLCGYVICFIYVVEISKHGAARCKHCSTTTEPLRENDSRTNEFITLRSSPVFLRQPWKILNDTCGKSGCLKSKNISWRHVAFVKSTAGNSRNRELLRRTWASMNYVDGARFDTVFVVGRTEKAVENSLLEEEHQRFGDILQYDGPDNYSQIAHKTLAGMAWASANLASECFYSTADDDFMVDIKSLKQKIDENQIKAKTENWPEYPILCGFTYGSAKLPVRNTKGLFHKWYMPFETYKWTVYPIFCHGGLYTTSVGVVRLLYKESKLLKPWSLDDVWITGFLRNRLGMPSNMVVPLKPPPGSHFVGFAGKDSKSNTLSKWKEILNTFENKNDLCSCL